MYLPEILEQCWGGWGSALGSLAQSHCRRYSGTVTWAIAGLCLSRHRGCQESTACIALPAGGAAGQLPAQLPASFVPDQLGSSSIKAAFVFTLFRGFWFHFEVWRSAQHQICWSCGVVEQASGLISAGFGYHLWWEPMTGLGEWQIFKSPMNYNYLTTSESSPWFYSVFIPAVEWTLWFQSKAACVSVSNQPGICRTIIGVASL